MAERRRCGPGLRVFGAEERWQRLHFLLHFHPWGEEKEGAIPTTPPLRLQKKKTNGELGLGGPRRPRPCTCAPESLARTAQRCKLSTFFVPSAPPLTQPRMHVPPSLFIHPPRSSAPPRFLPPLPSPRLRQC